MILVFILFSFLPVFWPFFGCLIVRTHFWLFTEVVRKIPGEVTRKVMGQGSRQQLGESERSSGLVSVTLRK